MRQRVESYHNANKHKAHALRRLNEQKKRRGGRGWSRRVPLARGFARQCALKPLAAQSDRQWHPAGFHKWDIPQDWIEPRRVPLARGFARQCALKTLAAQSDRQWHPAAQEAMEFIKSSLAQPDDSGWNVRWAMRFLGEHQRREAIPLLIKHLNYHYTSSHEIGTAYPAYQMLSQMGEAAWQASVESIENEENDLRLELRCRLALAIRGPVVGMNDLEKLGKAFEKDSANQKRWAKTMTRVKQPFADATLLEADHPEPRK